MIPGWLAQEMRDGPVSFERFMELALYHPDHGYYTKHITNVGRGGDFSTSATLSKALAHAIAGWVRAEIAAADISPPFHLIELGPGDGSLARDVLDALPWLTRRRCRLHLVEVSPPLRDKQSASLVKHRKRITWHDSLKDAVADFPSDAHPIIYSNEFFDAFPVRVFRRTTEQAEELFVGMGPQALEERWQVSQSLPDSRALDYPHADGHRFEVAESIMHWLHSNLDTLPRASLLTVDYGGSTAEIYHRRPHGTVRGYFLHNAVAAEAIYNNPGRQDLTADVNFEDLQRSTEALGFQTLELMSQRQFLEPVIHPRSDIDAFLSGPLGAGEAFKVLIQRKG